MGRDLIMRNLPAQLWQWDATDLVWGIRTRMISSREAVSSCLERIDAGKSEAERGRAGLA